MSGQDSDTGAVLKPRFRPRITLDYGLYLCFVDLVTRLLRPLQRPILRDISRPTRACCKKHCMDGHYVALTMISSVNVCSLDEFSLSFRLIACVYVETVAIAFEFAWSEDFKSNKGVGGFQRQKWSPLADILILCVWFVSRLSTFSSFG